MTTQEIPDRTAGMSWWPAGATAEYVAARQELGEAEIELRSQIEAVAKRRRELPLGAVMEDYSFQEAGASPGARTHVRLSELVAEARPLFVYHFMFGVDWEAGCPMCSMWLDGLNGVADHLAQHVNFVVIGKAEPEKLADWAHGRGWNKLRLLSSRDTSFNRDLNVEDENGEQNAGVSVFVKHEGQVRHFYSGRAFMTTDLLERGIDLLSPVWQVLDLLPGGRGDWYAGNDYVRTKSQ